MVLFCFVLIYCRRHARMGWFNEWRTTSFKRAWQTERVEFSFRILCIFSYSMIRTDGVLAWAPRASSIRGKRHRISPFFYSSFIPYAPYAPFLSLCLHTTVDVPILLTNHSTSCRNNRVHGWWSLSPVQRAFVSLVRSAGLTRGPERRSYSKQKVSWFSPASLAD